MEKVRLKQICRTFPEKRRAQQLNPATLPSYPLPLLPFPSAERIIGLNEDNLGRIR